VLKDVKKRMRNTRNKAKHAENLKNFACFALFRVFRVLFLKSIKLWNFCGLPCPSYAEAGDCREKLLMAKEVVHPTDEELWQQMLAGDRGAFELLYDRRQGNVYRFALRMSGSPTLAEDVTQDVFIALLRNEVQFDPAKGTVMGYLLGMARYRVLRRLERERAFISLAEGEEDDQAFANELMIVNADPLVELARADAIDAVRQAILALPVHYREVVVLCNLDEMSYEQAAGVIGCPVGTVRSRLNRARALLIERLRMARGRDEKAVFAG
jgi:RNA polymerase sigma-70 factor (ECF subfamily)